MKKLIALGLAGAMTATLRQLRFFGSRLYRLHRW